MLLAEERIEILTEAASISELSELDGLDVLVLVADQLPKGSLQSVLGSEEPPAVLLLSDQPGAARNLAGLPCAPGACYHRKAASLS